MLAVRGVPVTRLALLATLAGLSGCVVDVPAAPTTGYTACTSQLVEAPYRAEWTDTDSAAICGDGIPPTLIRVEWLGRSESCPTGGPGDIVGGVRGIRRVFGCLRGAAGLRL